MSGGGGGPRVPIPNNVQKTIQDIREITGKQHSDEDVYATLKECSMDPNETIQKLLYLDTFHEVKSRRDKKKEGLNSKASEDFRSKPGGQGRGARRSYSSSSPDAGGGRSGGFRRENGVNHNPEKVLTSSSRQVPQRTKNNRAPQVPRGSSAVPHVAGNESNGSSVHGLAPQLSLGGVMDVCDLSKQDDAQPQSAVPAVSSSLSNAFDSMVLVEQGKSKSSSDQFPSSASSSVSCVYSSSSDPLLAPSLSRSPVAIGAIRREVGSQRVPAGPDNFKGNKAIPYEVSNVVISETEGASSDHLWQKKETPSKSNEGEKSQSTETLQSPSLSAYDVAIRASSNQQPEDMEVSTFEAGTLSPIERKQHVTFPNHFQLPEALKNGLTFGSFESNFGAREQAVSGTDFGNGSMPALESSLGSEEAANSCSQSVPSTAKGENSSYPESSGYMMEETQHSEGNTISNPELKEQAQREVLLAPEGPPIPTVQNGQNYGLNFMSNMLGPIHVQFEVSEPQPQATSRLPNFVGGNPPPLSSPSPTPPLQGAIPPQSVPLFRQPYPPNFIPYGHYYHPPIYVSPLHQILSHNGFPQQPSAGNMYLTAAATAAGVKFPFPQLKPGTNSGNAAHIGIPSPSFISPPVGYAPSQTLNTGNSAGNEDLSASQLKENQIFTTGQLGEGSAVWIPSPGQDITGLQVNSLYNLPPQGQHLPFPTAQAGHGAFAGMYQPGQTLATTSTLMQQSQAVAGGIENIAPPSTAYQQPHQAQLNWNANF